MFDLDNKSYIQILLIDQYAIKHKIPKEIVLKIKKIILEEANSVLSELY